jgi:hypothetical protein
LDLSFKRDIFLQGKAMTTTLASSKLGGINAALHKNSRFKFKFNMVKTLILKV